MAQQSRIVAIGPREEMLGLRTVGAEIVCVESSAELVAALQEHARKEHAGLILISETLASGALSTVDELRAETEVVMLIVPSHRGPAGLTLDWLRQRMELTIGVDLISER